MTGKKYWLFLGLILLQGIYSISYSQDGFFKETELEILEFPGETVYKLRSSGELLNGHFKIQRTLGGYYQSRFVNGKPDGKWEQFNSNNKLLKEVNRLNGVLHGKNITYHPGTDKISTEIHFSEGQMDGPYVKQTLDGVVLEQRTYKAGKLDGVEKEFYKDGTLQKMVTYRDGLKTGMYEEYNEKGRLKTKVNYLNDLKSGTEELYNRDGTLVARISYKEGKRTEHQNITAIRQVK